MMSDFYEFNQSREDDFERREERRFRRELIVDPFYDSPVYESEGKVGRQPATSGAPERAERRQPINNSEGVA
jgi:hypothetical protein